MKKKEKKGRGEKRRKRGNKEGKEGNKRKTRGKRGVHYLNTALPSTL